MIFWIDVFCLFVVPLWKCWFYFHCEKQTLRKQLQFPPQLHPMKCYLVLLNFLLAWESRSSFITLLTNQSRIKGPINVCHRQSQSLAVIMRLPSPPPTSPPAHTPPAHQPPAHQLALLHHHSQYLDTSVHKQEQYIVTGERKPIRFTRESCTM